MHGYRFNRDPQRGDLVNVRGGYRDPGTVVHRGALVLEYYDANVYEPAYCQLLHDGEIFWAKVRDITIVTKREDVKKA